MAIHIDKIAPLRVVKTKFYTPVNKENKRYGSLIFLLLPPNNGDMLYDFINIHAKYRKYNTYNRLMVNSNMFYSLYEERNISYFITDKGLQTASGEVLENTQDYYMQKQQMLNESMDYIMTRDFFMDDTQINFFSENTTDSNIRRYLYRDRFKSIKELNEYYEVIKKNSMIKYTYPDIEKYKNRNLFVTMQKYLSSLMTNLKPSMNSIKGIDMLFSIMSRFFLDFRFNSYTKKSVVIPVSEWVKYLNIGENTNTILNPKAKLSPLNTIFYTLKHYPTKIQAWRDIDFIFVGDTGFFKYNFNEPNKVDTNKFFRCLDVLIRNVEIEDTPKEDAEDKATNILSRIETDTNVEINHITGKNDNPLGKYSLVQDKKTRTPEQIISNTIKYEVEENPDLDEDSIPENLDKNNAFKQSLIDLKMAEEAKTKKMSPERQRRFNELNNKFLSSQVDKKKVSDLLKTDDTPLKPISYTKVESIDDTWDDLKKPNFEKQYDVDSDIYKCIESFAKTNKDIPMAVISVNKEDTSTTEDSIYTYKVVLEDSLNKRHTLTFDVPKIVNERFLRLRGNDKVLGGQLMNLPIIKTEEDTVQVVSNYNKIFIRLNKPVGKASQRVDAMIRALNKMIETNYTDPDDEDKRKRESSDYIKEIIPGNNIKICKKYVLPIEYIDLASFFNKIKMKDHTIYFNQDEFRAKVKDKIKPNEMACITYGKNMDVYRALSMDEYMNNILETLLLDKYFKKLYDHYFTTQKSAAFSDAAILSSRIPLIIIMAYNVGLTTALERAKIRFDFQEKRPPRSEAFIKFKDGYLVYEPDASNIILLNGLYKFNTEDYSIKEIDSKPMWLDALDLYGAKYKADGLDSFYNLMIDPMTEEVCRHYQFPTEYIEILAYASSLLVTNEYNRHVDITGNRFRTNERIAHFVYKALATSYGNYLREVKNNRKAAKMTIKRTAVIDLAMEDSTMSDLSILTPLLELESANAVSFKGLSGMNSDRSYQLDKRTYDKSMLNKLAMSTGFAGNVGINRQTTINMDLEGTKGYMYNREDTLDEVNDANTLSITEALTPLGTTHDDPFRTAMTFIQTAKHGLRTEKSDPLLVSNGSDQALPYMTSDMFSFKAKEDGKVTKIKDDYMEVKYKSGKTDVVDLRSHVEKNSDGGFYINIKLDTELSVGKSFKAGDIIAFDKSSYSDDYGLGNLTYNIGKLSKIAILYTDEGFEDSTTVSASLAEDMASDIVVKVEALLDKTDVVLQHMNAGDKVIEGQKMFTYINAVDDPDATTVLNKLIDDKAAIESLGNISVTSKVTGVIQDIKIYSTVPTSEMSKSLRKFCEDIYNKEEKYLKAVRKPIPERVLPAIGKLKNSEDKILIEFYMTYHDTLSLGDKIVFFSALKGTIKRIYPNGKEPRSEFRKNETLKSLLPLSGVNARMVGSVPILTALNKVIVELDRAVKDIYGIKHNDGLDN